ncbi:MAG TPA: hypothetical protein VGL52_00530, partial [Casimicrobiaceae bacterium]
ECAREVETLIRPRRRGLDEKHRHTGIGRDSEVVPVVSGEAVRARRGRGGGKMHDACRRAIWNRERREANLGRPARGDRRPLRLRNASVDFQRDIDVLHSRSTRIRQPRGDDGAIALALVALDIDVGYGRVSERRVASGNVDVGDRRRVWKGNLVAHCPAAALKVGDEHDFTTRQIRTGENLRRELERRCITSTLRARPERADGGVERRGVLRGRSEGGGLVVERNDRCPIGWTKARDGAAGRGLCTRPMVASAHAVRSIDEDDELARAAPGSAERCGAAHKWPRERHHENRESQAAEDEQKDVPQLLTPHRPVRYPLQKHQRGKLNDLAPLPIDQVNDHGNRERREPGQKERSEKRHR